MSGLDAFFGALASGLRFGVAYNPLTAAVASGSAAALAGRPLGRARREAEAVGAVVAGWLLGDGLRVLGRARDLHDGVAVRALGGAPEWAGWAFVASWAVVSLVVGYAAPAAAGAAVGRRVTRGTGWLAAAAVAVALTLAISSGAGSLG